MGFQPGSNHQRVCVEIVCPISSAVQVPDTALNNVRLFGLGGRADGKIREMFVQSVYVKDRLRAGSKLVRWFA